ncbi:MAG: hypothetical protein KC413_11910, partial [Anaerolineales bacterium]|nr:hypothetical protein [Anaerolineales bacterium]
MDAFQYQQGQLYCESVSLADIAKEVGTPFYVYSESALLARARTYMTAVSMETAVSAPDALVCYAVKANGNPAIIRRLGEAGFGADVTSGGELF